METSYIVENIKNSFNISKPKSIIVRAKLSKYNYINTGKHTYHINDVFYMIYAFLLCPSNNRKAPDFFEEFKENSDFIVDAFQKIMYIGLDNIDQITLGKFYMIVNCKNRIHSFNAGKILDVYLDRSVTITGETLTKFFNSLK